MTARGAATEVGHAQVAGVDEADELRSLVVQKGVRAYRVGRTRPCVREPGGDVGEFFSVRLRITAVTVGASETQGPFFGRAVRIGNRAMAFHTTRTLERRLLRRLPKQIDFP